MTHTLAELDVLVGELTEAQNDKMDRDGRNGTSAVDYVVEWKVPTNADPTWYRLYKSGWLEQGGIINTYQLTFPKPFRDTLYTITALPIVHSGDGGANDMQYQNKTNSSIDIRIRWTGSYAPANTDERCWRAEGMSAQT